MALWSCRSLFCQCLQRDKLNQVIGDTDTLLPLAAALVQTLDVDGLYKSPQGVGRQLFLVPHTCVPVG